MVVIIIIISIIIIIIRTIIIIILIIILIIIIISIINNRIVLATLFNASIQDRKLPARIVRSIIIVLYLAMLRNGRVCPHPNPSLLTIAQVLHPRGCRT